LVAFEVEYRYFEERDIGSLDQVEFNNEYRGGDRADASNDKNLAKLTLFKRVPSWWRYIK
jgi:hypothetical protein